MPQITCHAFLTPAHNCWTVWSADGSENIVNEQSSTHRTLETLTYAIDHMARNGWRVKDIFADQGIPNLVLLVREEETE